MSCRCRSPLQQASRACDLQLLFLLQHQRPIDTDATVGWYLEWIADEKHGAKPVGRSGSRTERWRLYGSLFAFLPQGSAKAVRLRTCFDNVRLIGQPVEHGLAEPGIGKDLRPLGER